MSDPVVYATVEDVQARMTRTLNENELSVCETLLKDAAVMIDAAALSAGTNEKNVVSCRMVIRILGDGGAASVPVGSTQGSMGGLGYTQSWTVGSGGSVGELYLSRADKRLLGIGNRIGSYSPVEELTCSEE